MHSFGYLFKEGIKSLWKNRTMSIASIGVLISCLLLTGVAGVFTINLSSFMRTVEGSNRISIFLQEDISRLAAIRLGEEINKIENISDIEFVPNEEGINKVIGILGENGSLLSGIGQNEENFLPDAYTVSMKDLNYYEETIQKLKAIEGVESTTDYSQTADRLNKLNNLISYGSIAIFTILGVVALFIISNTIRVTMFSRRMEISIMKSVGATNGFIRIPFVVEGVAIGVLAGGISSVIMLLIYEKVEEVLSGVAAFLTLVDITPYKFWIVLAFLTIGMLFGIVAGGISIGKYLRKEGEEALV